MIDIAELKKKISGRTTIDDLVMAIIYIANPSPIVPKSNARFQKAFFTLQEQFHGLLDSISFDPSSFTPYSEELDEALFRLETSTILSTLNPRYQNYSIEGKTDIFKEAFAKFSLYEQENLKAMGDRLKEIFTAEEEA